MSHNQHSRNKLRSKYPSPPWPLAHTERHGVAFPRSRCSRSSDPRCPKTLAPHLTRCARAPPKLRSRSDAGRWDRGKKGSFSSPSGGVALPSRTRPAGRDAPAGGRAGRGQRCSPAAPVTWRGRSLGGSRGELIRLPGRETQPRKQRGELPRGEGPPSQPLPPAAAAALTPPPRPGRARARRPPAAAPGPQRGRGRWSRNARRGAEPRRPAPPVPPRPRPVRAGRTAHWRPLRPLSRASRNQPSAAPRSHSPRRREVRAETGQRLASTGVRSRRSACALRAPATAPSVRGSGGRAASEGGRLAAAGAGGTRGAAGGGTPRASPRRGPAGAPAAAERRRGPAAADPGCAPVCVQSEREARAPSGAAMRKQAPGNSSAPRSPRRAAPARSPRRPAASPAARQQLRRGARSRRPTASTALPSPRPPARPPSRRRPRCHTHPTPAHARGCPRPLEGEGKGPAEPAGGRGGRGHRAGRQAAAAAGCGCARGGIMCHNKLLNVTLRLNCAAAAAGPPGAGAAE